MATIQGIYIALFGRPADPVGLDYFNKATGNGANLSTIGDLASTAEYQTRFQGLDSTEVITAIYQSLFARNPEQEGLTFFVNALAAGTYTINNVAIAVLDGAQGPDLEIVRNKISAASIFTGAIDSGDELAAYRGTKAADAGRTFITPVTADDDTIPTEAQADAALALLITGPAPSSQFVLTEGFDSADTAGAHVNGKDGDPGTVANFKFTGVDESIIATSTTLGRFDSLIDGTTTDADRLELTLTEGVIFPVTKNIEIIEIDANTSSSSSINMALVEGAKTLDLNGLLGERLTITDIFSTGITVVDGSGLKSGEPTSGFILDFSATSGAAAITITGSAANDVLKAAAGDDVVNGGAGSDFIYGNGGNDKIDGGGGMNAMVGGAGDDIIRGGSELDALGGEDGRDTLIGGGGNDFYSLYGQAIVEPYLPDTFTDTVVLEATGAQNGSDMISGFQTAGAGPDRFDVSAFLGAPVSFFAFADGIIGKGGMGFDGSGFNVIALVQDVDVDTVEELTDAIGADATNLFIGNNARAVIAMPKEGDTQLFFVTTDGTGQASEVSLVGTLSEVNSGLTAVNFI